MNIEKIKEIFADEAFVKGLFELETAAESSELPTKCWSRIHGHMEHWSARRRRFVRNWRTCLPESELSIKNCVGTLAFQHSFFVFFENIGDLSAFCCPFPFKLSWLLFCTTPLASETPKFPVTDTEMGCRFMVKVYSQERLYAF